MADDDRPEATAASVDGTAEKAAEIGGWKYEIGWDEDGQGTLFSKI
jgi:hypothetical protein